MRLEGSCYCCQLDTLTILLAAESPFCFNAFLSLFFFCVEEILQVLFKQYFSSIQVFYLAPLLYSFLVHIKVNKLFKYIYIYLRYQLSQKNCTTNTFIQSQQQLYREEKNITIAKMVKVVKVVLFMEKVFFKTSIRYFILLEFLKQYFTSIVVVF